MGVLTFAACAVLAPASASAAGCEVLDGIRERAACEARAEARSAARAEVDRALEDRAGEDASAGSASANRSAAWEHAIADADGLHLDSLLAPRPLAAVGGLAWFALVLRSRRRARARTRA